MDSTVVHRVVLAADTSGGGLTAVLTCQRVGDRAALGRTALMSTLLLGHGGQVDGAHVLVGVGGDDGGVVPDGGVHGVADVAGHVGQGAAEGDDGGGVGGVDAHGGEFGDVFGQVCAVAAGVQQG